MISIFARRFWSGDAGAAGEVLSALLAPLSWAFGVVVGARNKSYDQSGGERIAGCSVICVGNLAVGGTGKTPLAAWVAALAREQGVSVALVARGYGADESALHARWNPDVPLFVDADRIAAVRRAVEEGASAVVLDDGFQHRRLARDLDLVLLATEDVFPGRLLPAGPYREPASALTRADAVIVTRRTSSAETANAHVDQVRSITSCPVACVQLASGAWEDLAGGSAPAPMGDVVAVAAVARPDDFRENVAAVTEGSVALIAFPDHHDYSERDIERIIHEAGARTIVVTEKDAVKLVRFERRLEAARVLTQELRWESGREQVEAILLSALQS